MDKRLEPCTTAREMTAAEKIEEQVELLLKKAVTLDDYTHGKLDRIMHSPNPADPMPCGAEEVLPPFFQNMRDILSGIERRIDSVRSAVDRVAV